jgi:hypothetical protein
MSIVRDKTTLSRMSALSIHNGTFRTSNLGPLANAMRSSDETAFRELFDEIENLGDVPHDSSIIGPAAYLADLLRMVTAKEQHNGNLPESRRLKARRPDIWKVPLDARHTTELHRYLLLVNRALGMQFQYGTTDDDFRRAALVDYRSYDLCRFDAPVSRIGHAYAAAGHPVAEVLTALHLPDAARLARLSVTMTEYLELTSSTQYQQKREADNLQYKVMFLTDLSPADPDATPESNLLAQMLRLGIPDGLIRAATGTEKFNDSVVVLLGAAIAQSETNESHAVIGQRAYVLIEHNGGLVLGYHDPSNLYDRPLAAPTLEPIQADGDVWRRYTALLSEMKRVARLAEAVGWPIEDFLHVYQAFCWSRSDSMSYLMDADVDRLIHARDFQLRHKLTLETTVMIFVQQYGYPNTPPGGEPGCFARFFPGVDVQDARYQMEYKIGDLPVWQSSGFSMERNVVREIYAMPERLRIKSLPPSAQPDAIAAIEQTEITLGGFNLLLPYRYRCLADVFAISVPELLAVQYHWDLPLGTWDETVALIDALQIIKDTGLPVLDVLAMTHAATTATCQAKDIRDLSNAVVSAALWVEPPEGTDEYSTFWWNQVGKVVKVAAAHFKVPEPLFEQLVYASMEGIEQMELFKGLLSGEFTDLADGVSVMTSDATIGFSNLQSVMKFAGAFELDVPTLAMREYDGGIGVTDDVRHQWRSAGNLGVWVRLHKFRKEHGFNPATFADTLSKTFFASQTNGADALAPDPDTDVADPIGMMMRRSGLSRADLEPHWTDRTQPPFHQVVGEPGQIELMMQLCDTGKVLGTLGISLAQAHEMAQLFAQGSVAADYRERTRYFQDRSAFATGIVNALKSVRTQTDFAKIEETAEIAFLKDERDALCNWLIETKYRTSYADRPDASPQDYFPYRIETREDLSDYMLIDVEMGGAAQISEVKLALNSVQRYIQRVLSQQETDPTPFQVDPNQWTWRAHYRLWEANRKVFLFPENFLDPNLRLVKSPLFQDLEDALLQNDINDDTVGAALLGYLDGLQDLSDLQVVSACAAEMHRPGGLTTQRKILLLGRGRAKGAPYHMRACIFDDAGLKPIRWTPWEPVHLPRHAEDVCLAVVNNRPTLFWAEVQDVGHPPSNSTDTRQNAYFVTLQHSVKRLGKGWTEPRPIDGQVDLPLGVIAQTKAGDWHCLGDLLPIQIQYPADTPQVFFTVQGRAVDTEPHSRHPRIVAQLDGREDLTKSHNQAGSALTDLPTPSCWAWSYDISDNTWMDSTTVPQIWQGRGGVMSDLRSFSLVTTSSRTTTIGIFSDVLRSFCLARTADFGASWHIHEEGLVQNGNQHSPYGNAIARKLVAATRSHEVYLIGGSMPILFRCSYDEGLSWQSAQVPPGMGQYVDFAVGHDGKTLAMSGYVDATHESGILFLSADGGDTWVRQTGLEAHQKATGEGGAQITGLAFDQETNALIATSDRRIWSSLDQGQTWHEYNRRPSLHLSLRSGPRAGLYAIDGHNVLVSHDGGYSFEGLGPSTGQDINNLFCLEGQIVITQDTAVLTYRESQDAWIPLPYLDAKAAQTGSIDPSGKLIGLGLAVCAMVDAGRPGQIMVGHTGTGLICSLPRWSVGILRKANDTQLLYGGNHAASEHPDTRFKTINCMTTAPAELARILTSHGVDAMMSLDTQTSLIDSTPSKPSDKFPIQLGSDQPYALYYRELFFHLPYLIADALNRNKKFKAAQNWYRYIFSPNLMGAAPIAGDESPYWRFKGFRGYTLDHLTNITEAEFDLYENDPFDAHAIAAIRLGAYEKAVVMRYIDNLLDWGDELFTQDSWETITEATSYYLEAADLLGPDPRKARARIDRVDPTDPLTVEGFLKDSAFSTTPDNAFHMEDHTAFPIPSNAYFDKYWVRVQDRLAKIRASENIKGTKRDLALFQPPIDPRKIMAALAAGYSLSEAVASLDNPLPRYRFETLLRGAKDFTGTVIAFSSALLAALEKRDADALARLRSTQERDLMDMASKAKDLAVTAAQTRLNELAAQKTNAMNRRDHFDNLNTNGMLEPENNAQDQKTAALVLQSATAAIRGASAPLYLFPSIFGVANGGQNAGRALEVSASSMDSAAVALLTSAGMADSRGQNDRRAKDWQWQRAQAQADMDRLDIETEIATTAVNQAKTDQALHQTQLEHREDLIAYTADRFTNSQLYAWMVGQLSSVYRTGFNLALEFAREAERAHRFERGIGNDTPEVITQGAVVSLAGALASGQHLQLALAQLEKTHRDSLSAEVQVEKTMSLATIGSDPALGVICADWKKICENGYLEFEITPEFLKTDNLGEAYRRIRSVAVTLPAIVVPYQNLSGILSQLSYLDASGQTVERSGPNAAQISISHGVNDTGWSETGDRADRLRPFECTGAAGSKWSLKLPHGGRDAILDSLSDVVVHIVYVT